MVRKGWDIGVERELARKETDIDKLWKVCNEVHTFFTAGFAAFLAGAASFFDGTAFTGTFFAAGMMRTNGWLRVWN
jgi:hypothetical protein